MRHLLKLISGARRLFLLLLALPGCVLNAQAWPDRPIRLVVPYPPGAMGDTLARMLSERMQPALGQPVIVENRAGAGGNIGAASVAKPGGDGHTFLIAATNNLVINQHLYPNMPFDPLKALQPVTMLVDVPSAIFVHAKVPANTLQAFMQHAKAHPGGVNYASPGSGTTVHIFSEALNQRHGLHMMHVPYKGAAQALTAVLGEEVQMLAIGAGVGAPHVRTGKLRMLAISGSHRSSAFPDVPTFAQAGLHDIVASNWWAVAAPADMPADTVQRFRDELARAMTQPGIAQRLQELGAVPVLNTPGEMALQLQREALFWGQMVRETRVKLD